LKRKAVGGFLGGFLVGGCYNRSSKGNLKSFTRPMKKEDYSEEKKIESQEDLAGKWGAETPNFVVATTAAKNTGIGRNSRTYLHPYLERCEGKRGEGRG